MSNRFVTYTDSVEVLQPGEEKTFDEITATMLDLSKKIGERQRHTVRSVHAKSHGLLKAQVTVLDGLPSELKQGLFARPGSYGAIMRFSTNPGDILSDHISTPRGLAIKIIGVEGEMISNHAGQVTQDFVMVNSKVFSDPNANSFLKNLKTLDAHANDSEALKQTVSSVAQVAESALEVVGQKSGLLLGFGHPATNPLGETFSTVAPLRYGEYFGKLELVPVSPNLVELCQKALEHPHDWNALRDTIVDFFTTQTAIWELRVQLCTDLEKMPVEAADVAWDETLSPYLTVAQITAGPQQAYSDARRVFVDEQLSFNPWHCLSAHRPLGNVMRARFKAYQASVKFRQAAEGRTLVEPRSIEELPD
jgi:hypothetical protein